MVAEDRNMKMKNIKKKYLKAKKITLQKKDQKMFYLNSINLFLKKKTV